MEKNYSKKACFGVKIDLTISSSGASENESHSQYTIYGPVDLLAAARARHLAPLERLCATSAGAVATRDEGGVLRGVEANRAEPVVVVVAPRAC